jgi:hypothetical protein
LDAASSVSPRSLRSGRVPLDEIIVQRLTRRQLVILAEDEAEALDPVDETGRRNVGLYLSSEKHQ